MTVCVTIPYYKTAQYVERAVRSVLAQTERDLVCVVIGDGDVPPLPPIADDRLIIHSYPVNHGVYFAQDVAIWASPFEWYAVVASDDWVDPDHIERLLEQGGDLCAGGVRAHGDGEGYCGPDNDDHTRCSGVISPPRWAQGNRKAFEVGLYRVERYREIGAHNPSERIGQDSATLHIQRMVAPVGVSDYVTYNRRYRDGSLCTAPETKRGSEARNSMRARNAAVYAACERIVRRTPDRTLRAARIRAFRESIVPPVIREALAEQVDALAGRLGVAVAA